MRRLSAYQALFLAEMVYLGGRYCPGKMFRTARALVAKGLVANSRLDSPLHFRATSAGMNRVLLGTETGKR